jgi:hypothetical protein
MGVKARKEFAGSGTEHDFARERDGSAWPLMPGLDLRESALRSEAQQKGQLALRKMSRFPELTKPAGRFCHTWKYRRMVAD